MSRCERFCEGQEGVKVAAIAMVALGVALSFGAAAQLWPWAPRGFAAAPGDAEAMLSWTEPPPWVSGITGYSVRYANSTAALSSEAWTAVAGSDATTVGHTVSSLTNGTRYYFQVRSASVDGDGPPSYVATIQLAASPTALVTINDHGLRSALERTLGVKAGAEITQLDLATLVGRLGAAGARISNLAGLEYAVNLTELYLPDNSISDISVLGSLTELYTLDLSYNSISDVSVLDSLASLSYVFLNNNNISDVSAVGSALGRLGSFRFHGQRHLDLSNNAISDISPLVSIQGLEGLVLSGNSISDISALRRFRFRRESEHSAAYLLLNNNAISDISALGSLNYVTHIYLADNKVSDVSALGRLRDLTTLELNNNTISDVSALRSLRELAFLHLNNNMISDVSALRSLRDLVGLELQNNAITNVSALAGLGRSDSTRLRTLLLDGNGLETLPDGLFAGLAGLRELSLEDNPGAPFALAVELARTDADPWAPGPATVQARFALGAPFALRSELLVEPAAAGLPGTVEIGAGATTGMPFAVASTSTLRLLAGPAVLPTARCGDVQCFRGIEPAPGETLVLYRRPPPQAQPAPVPKPLQGGDGLRLPLASLILPGDGDPGGLRWRASSSDESVATARVVGGRLVVTPEPGAEGAVEIVLEAVDETGLAATLRFEVRVEFHWPVRQAGGWRASALIDAALRD